MESPAQAFSRRPSKSMRGRLLGTGATTPRRRRASSRSESKALSSTTATTALILLLFTHQGLCNAASNPESDAEGGIKSGVLTSAVRDNQGTGLRPLDLLTEQLLRLEDSACAKRGANKLRDLEGLRSEMDCALDCHRRDGCVAYTWWGQDSLCGMFSSCRAVEEITRPRGSNRDSTPSGGAVTGLFLFTDAKIACHGDAQNSQLLGTRWPTGYSEEEVRCSYFCDRLRSTGGTLVTKGAGAPLISDSWASDNVYENTKTFSIGCGPPTALCTCRDVVYLPDTGENDRGALEVTVEDTALKRLWRLEAGFQVRLFDNFECGNFYGTLQKIPDDSRTASSCANHCQQHPDCIAFTLRLDLQLCVLKSVCNELQEHVDSFGVPIGNVLSGMFLIKDNTIICHPSLHEQPGAFGRALEGRNACRDWCEYSGGFLAGMGSAISHGNLRDQWSQGDVEQNRKSFGLACGLRCICEDVKSVPPSTERDFTELNRWGGWEMTGHLSHHTVDLYGRSLPSQKPEDLVHSIYGRLCADHRVVLATNASKADCMELCQNQDGCTAFMHQQSKCDLLSSCSGLAPWASEHASDMTGLLKYAEGALICHNNTGDQFYKVPEVTSNDYAQYLENTCATWCTSLGSNRATVLERSSTWVQSLDTWNAYDITDNRRLYGFECDSKRVCTCQGIKHLHRSKQSI